MHPAEYLSRKAAAEHVSRRVGRRMTVAALARQASDGTGPIYRMILGRASYLVEDLDAWIEGLVSEPVKRGHASYRPLTRDDGTGPEGSDNADSGRAVAA